MKHSNLALATLVLLFASGGAATADEAAASSQDGPSSEAAARGLVSPELALTQVRRMAGYDSGKNTESAGGFVVLPTEVLVPLRAITGSFPLMGL